MSTDARPFAAAVRSAALKLRSDHPDGVPLATIGTLAWKELTPEQQVAAAPRLMELFVQEVLTEQHEQTLDRDAADRTCTYLEPVDTAMAWEAVHDRPDGEGSVSVSRSALMNVLCELELLQHRVAMRDRTGGTP